MNIAAKTACTDETAEALATHPAFADCSIDTICKVAQAPSVLAKLICLDLLQEKTELTLKQTHTKSELQLFKHNFIAAQMPQARFSASVWLCSNRISNAFDFLHRDFIDACSTFDLPKQAELVMFGFANSKEHEHASFRRDMQLPIPSF